MPQTPQGMVSQFIFTGEYSTPYTALIRTNVVMGVSRYFLERWVPVLGPAPATLVNTLRQLDYRCQADTITISGAALAQEAAMSRRHLYTCLEAPGVGVFVQALSGQRSRTENGQIVQQINRYRICMDDPLIPADAEQLCTVLQRLADDPISAGQRALTIPPRELWNVDLHTPAERFSTLHTITAREVLLRAFPTWNPATEAQQREFAQLSEALHHHLTLVHEDGRTSKIIVPQYFRQHWWKRLGHDLAWIYLWLRGQTYDNPEEGLRRNTCWVPSLTPLLTTINRPREWWRRNVENATQQPEGWELTDFFKQTHAQKGRDPAHPQWVARQFEIALDIPVAPEDQARYQDLLNTWQASGTGLTPPDADLTQTDAVSPDYPTSAILKHTGSPNLRHIRIHRSDPALPQQNTPVKQKCATFEHTGQEGVRHSSTQGSTTPVHRKKESPKATLQASTELIHHQHSQENAAAAPEIREAEFSQSLFRQLTSMLEQTPTTPLYRAAAPPVWLQHAWPEPVRPHTPAWTLIIEGQIAPRDLVALMLAVWADRSIQHPPRYLSWLIQRWQTLPDTPPVDYWDRWRALAELPLAEWPQRGRAEWAALTADPRRALPFGLDVLWEETPSSDAVEGNDAMVLPMVARFPYAVPPEEPQAEHGLDDFLDDGILTARDVWRTTLGQLSVQLSRPTYTNWVEGSQPVSYANGVLTVRARNITARDQLARRLNPSIEQVASSVAQQPIKILYTVENSLLTTGKVPVVKPGTKTEEGFA